MKKLVGALSLVIIMLLVLSCKPDGNVVPEANNPDSNVPVAFSAGESIWDLLFAGDEMWVGTIGGVVRCDMKKGTIQKYTTRDGLGSNVVRKLVRDSRGNIWVTCYMAGVSRFDGTKWQNFTVSDGLISDDVITLEADSQGGVWVSAYWGVSYYDGTEWQAFTSLEPGSLVVGGKNPNNPEATLIEDVELSAADVIFIDSRGDVWFSTRGRGVNHFDGENWKLFSSEDGLAEGGVTAITEDKDGNLWFGCMNSITCFDGSQIQIFTIKEHQSIIPRPHIQDIRQDKQGNIWVAAFGGGVSRYDGTNWRVFTPADGLPSDNARLIYLDREGNPGVITDKGVSRFRGTSWQTLTPEDGLPDGEIRAVVTDDDGNLWFGGAGGEIRRIQ
ncbi:MAG: two-component regulator propeller domain-containing protein [Dehalococcoidales bacterium]|nr:two-component regulator propeller domain-containing protein [Dehalococcoidales bacterium]